ncbi:phosphoribosyltransferase [Burkholderia vietnamiensis]|uniref:phosphoribosyltransferase n=1 Tax=Burkholderia vietnamiensis TaxID=60552 RepID=UPI0009BE2BE2|nr:phosphoribosyltransferase family protein [Burkholderia vietnamiensis]MDN8035300.1 phosphoribosyltransferase family protein [Burkholderia vietnamiensis]
MAPNLPECFTDRADAGRRLAHALHGYADRRDVVVLALPRGGVPVAFPVAQALRAPLDLLIVRKLGMPSDPELAIGALATGGAIHLRHAAIRAMGVTRDQLADVIARETAELQRRDALYRGARLPLPVEGRVVIVVDDGVATGASMRVALQALRARRPARIVAAVPVAPAGAAHMFDDVADAFVTVLQPARFFGIGQFYADFDQVGDDEVRALLDAARARHDGISPA